jgi:hypothetical protein
MVQVASKFLTPAAYARHRGVSRPAVARAVREGRISTTADGLIEHAVADLQWQANTRPRAKATEAAAPVLAGDVVSYQEARRRQAVADALMAERAELLQAGELIRVQAVRDALALDYATTREGLLQLPARLGPLLAAELDPAAVERLLRAEIHQALTRLAGAGEALGRTDAGAADA